VGVVLIHLNGQTDEQIGRHTDRQMKLIYTFHDYANMPNKN